jgi:hypothetical protein
MDRFKRSIRDELGSLARIADETEQFLISLPSKVDMVHTRAAGSLLHDYYTGVEKVFKTVCLHQTGELPHGAAWHRELLDAMKNLPADRAPLLTESMHEQLREYLAFRHVFRNAYGFTLSWELIEPLCRRLPRLHETLAARLTDLLA